MTKYVIPLMWKKCILTGTIHSNAPSSDRDNSKSQRNISHELQIQRHVMLKHGGQK